MKAKYVLMFLVLIELTAGANAFNFSVGPDRLDINLIKDVRECRNFIINTDEKLVVEDRWGYFNSFNPEDYGYFKEDLGITVRYDFSKYSLNHILEICFSGSKLGEYYGLITFYSQNGRINTRVHMYVNRSGEMESNLLDGGMEKLGFSGRVSLVLSILLLFVLIYLLRKRKYK